MADTPGEPTPAAFDPTDFFYALNELAYKDFERLFTAMRAVGLIVDDQALDNRVDGITADETAALLHVFTNYGDACLRQAQPVRPVRKAGA